MIEDISLGDGRTRWQQSSGGAGVRLEASSGCEARCARAVRLQTYARPSTTPSTQGVPTRTTRVATDASVGKCVCQEASAAITTAAEAGGVDAIWLHRQGARALQRRTCERASARVARVFGMWAYTRRRDREFARSARHLSAIQHDERGLGGLRRGRSCKHHQEQLVFPAGGRNGGAPCRRVRMGDQEDEHNIVRLLDGLVCRDERHSSPNGSVGPVASAATGGVTRCTGVLRIRRG